MQKIRIKIKGYDSKVVDSTCKQIVDDAIRSGSKISGPIPLPSRRKIFTVLRSPHIDSKSKEHFQMIHYVRLIEIIEPNAKTIETLTHLQVPSGVGIEIK